MIDKNLEQEINFILRQWDAGNFPPSLFERTMVIIRELRKIIDDKRLFVYEDGSLKEEDEKRIQDKYILVSYRQGAKPPQIIE